MYVRRDTLLLGDVLNNSWNKCPEIYGLDPFFCTRISMESSLKRTKAKLEILTDIDTLLMVEKSIGGGICNGIYWYAKPNN